MSKSKKSLGEPKEYDYRLVEGLGTAEGGWWAQVYKGDHWQYVKLFWTEKEAQNWLKGGVPSYRFSK